MPFSRLLAVLPARRRRLLIGVVASALVSALFEVAGVASILPFMALVMDPAALERFGPLAALLASVGIDAHREAIFAVGVATVAVLALGNASAAANLWVQTRFTATIRRDLSSELFDGYLRQPYAFHVQRDAASLIKVAFADVESALGGFLGSLLSAFAKGLAAGLLLAMLVWRDPWVALGIVVLLGGGYALIYRIVRERQSRLGREMTAANADRSRSALEGLGGVKELRVLGRERSAMYGFRESTNILTHAQVASVLVASLPRYLVETLAFGGIVAITLLLVITSDVRDAIPTLALYAFAGYRLMPAAQQFYNSAVTIRYHSAAVASLEADLAIVRAAPAVPLAEDPAPLAFEREVLLKDVTFQYPGASRPALRNLTLAIPRNRSLGLVGRTGAGKTTLVDLLLALYRPDAGRLTVDGVELSEQNERAWRRRVGYVPQGVFLANASVAENIALGLPGNRINRAAVERAARMAQAQDFIAGLPQGFDTLVGERGVRLSGGQRQRLGIARALYHDPEMLVFDEATSALDGLTEDAVMQAIRDLSRERTVILIAHRLRTVQACDRIVMLEEGSIVADGTHDELLSCSLPFKRLAGELRDPRLQVSA